MIDTKHTNNLELAEIIKKLDSHPVSTELHKLCRTSTGEIEEKFLEVGTVYWHFISDEEKRLLSLNVCQWVRIKLTYIRSGVYFYIYPDYPNASEQWSPTNSLNAMMLHFEEFYPEKYGWSPDWNWDTIDGRVKIKRLNNKEK